MAKSKDAQPESAPEPKAAKIDLLAGVDKLGATIFGSADKIVEGIGDMVIAEINNLTGEAKEFWNQQYGTVFERHKNIKAQLVNTTEPLSVNQKRTLAERYKSSLNSLHNITADVIPEYAKNELLERSANFLSGALQMIVGVFKGGK